MKHLNYFFVFLIILLSIGCKQNGQVVNYTESATVKSTHIIVNDKEGIEFLKEFYTKYYGEYEHRKGIDNFVSSRILNRMDSLTSADNLVLDYDPFIRGQDWSARVLLKSLEIKPLENKNEYRVSFLLFGFKNEERTHIDLLLNKDDYDKILIYSILSDKHFDFQGKQVTNLHNENTTVNVLGNDLVINYSGNELIIKDIIINAMSLSTSLYILNSNEFYVTYEYNASSTKRKIVYKYSFFNEKLYLNFKEFNIMGPNGYQFYRIYLKDYILLNQDFEILENIGSVLQNLPYERKNINSNIDLYNFNGDLFGSLLSSISNENRFIESPIINDSPNNYNIKIINVKKLNDIAYYLEQSGNFEEAVFLLEKIIKESPKRVVARLNLADAYWGLGKDKEAKKNYEKYIYLMKSQGKDIKRIPQRVYERIK